MPRRGVWVGRLGGSRLVTGKVYDIVRYEIHRRLGISQISMERTCFKASAGSFLVSRVLWHLQSMFQLSLVSMAISCIVCPRTS
jgi:hypothetical protein